MAKEIRPTVGLIDCDHCGTKDNEVRRNINGKYYFNCDCGQNPKNLAAGQAWILRNARMFSQEEFEEFNARPIGKGGRRVAEIEDDQVAAKSQTPSPEPDTQGDDLPPPPPHKPTEEAADQEVNQDKGGRRAGGMWDGW